jgi:Mn2+/Fe2+ NRAMP family transporter
VSATPVRALSPDSRFRAGVLLGALLAGMAVAIAVKAFRFNVGNLIIFAQALTVLGNPLLAAAMLWLATRKDMTGERHVPAWIKIVASLGLAVVLLLSLRTAVRLVLQVTAL